MGNLDIERTRALAATLEYDDTRTEILERLVRHAADLNARLDCVDQALARRRTEIASTDEAIEGLAANEKGLDVRVGELCRRLDGVHARVAHLWANQPERAPELIQPPSGGGSLDPPAPGVDDSGVDPHPRRPHLARFERDFGTRVQVGVHCGRVLRATLHDLYGDYAFRVEVTGSGEQDALDRLDVFLSEIQRHEAARLRSALRRIAARPLVAGGPTDADPAAAMKVIAIEALGEAPTPHGGVR